MHALLSAVLLAAAPEVTATQPGVDAAPRHFSLTAGLHAGSTTSAWSSTGNTSGGWGFFVRGGVVGAPLGVELELSAANLLVTGYLRGAITVSLSPTRWLTLAGGAVVGENFMLFVGPEATYLGATARLELKLFRIKQRDVTIGGAFDYGVTVRASRHWSTPGQSWGAFALLGFTLF